MFNFYGLSSDLQYALGILGIVAAISGALIVISRRGTAIRNMASYVFGFVVFMGLVAAGALMIDGINNILVMSAGSAFYGVVAGLLSAKRQRGIFRALERLSVLVPAGLVLFALFSLAMKLTIPGTTLTTIEQLAYGGFIAMFTLFVIGDFQYLLAGAGGTTRRKRRHALRTGLAAAEMFRAPLAVIAPSMVADAQLVPVLIFGPYLLIPLFFLLSVPGAGQENKNPDLTKLRRAA